MKFYLKDILKRLQKYSASLDQDSLLVDKPWIVSNSDGKFEKLIFKRDGSVIFSVNGDVTIGSWEYLPEAQSLLIDYGDKKKLYRHQYLDEAVLALKIDGSDHADDSYYLLANENVVKDHDAKKYLSQKKILRNSFNVDHFLYDLSAGTKKTLADAKITDGTVFVESSRSILLVKNSKVKKHLYPKMHEGEIEIWQKGGAPQKGDVVMNSSASSMITTLYGTRYYLTIDKNGVIVSVKNY